MRSGNRCWLVVPLVLGLGSLHPTVAAEPTEFQRVRAENDALRAKLRQPTKVDVIETPFSDVIKDLSKELDITIILDPEGLEESDVTPDQLISLNLQDKRADAIFRLLLEPLHLDCGVRDGLLVITSRKKYQAEFLSIRAFKVQNLLDNAGTLSAPLPRWKEPAKRRTDGVAKGEAPAGGGFGRMGGMVDQAEPPSTDPETPADHLVSMVCDSVAPQSWAHRGGQATAKVFAGVLVVRQTEEALAEIADLIDQMQRATAVEDPLKQ